MARTRRTREGLRGASFDRLKIVGLGALLGFAWGTALWALATVLGDDTTAAQWLYISVTTAMIGGGVGGMFGAFQAKKRGERVWPRLFRRRP